MCICVSDVLVLCDELFVCVTGFDIEIYRSNDIQEHSLSLFHHNTIG